MAVRLTLLVLGSVVFTLALALMVAFLVGSIVVPQIAGDRGSSQNPYASVVGPELIGRPVTRFTVNSTKGVIEVPVPGRVNVITPQYVGCPDVCHWETAILLALFQLVYENGLTDKVAFITIGVDPWSENLDIARGYQLARAKQWLEKNIYWAWVYDNLTVMNRLWGEYEIYVERDNRTGLVTHFAGFIVVVKDRISYLVVPTAEGWSKPGKVAEILYNIIVRETEKLEGGGSG